MIVCPELENWNIREWKIVWVVVEMRNHFSMVDRLNSPDIAAADTPSLCSMLTSALPPYSWLDECKRAFDATAKSTVFSGFRTTRFDPTTQTEVQVEIDAAEFVSQLTRDTHWPRLYGERYGKATWDALNARFADYIRHSMPPVPRDFYVWRGLRWDRTLGDEAHAHARFVDSLKVGAFIPHSKIISSSMQSRVAVGFARDMPEVTRQKIVFRIRVPAGTRGVLPTNIHNPWESEILLDNRCRLVVDELPKIRKLSWANVSVCEDTPILSVNCTLRCDL